MQVQSALESGTPVDHHTVQAITEAVIRTAGRDYIIDELKFAASKTWCNTLLRSMNLRMRSVTTDGAKLPSDWEKRGERLGLQVRFHHFKKHVLYILELHLHARNPWLQCMLFFVAFGLFRNVTVMRSVL